MTETGWRERLAPLQQVGPPWLYTLSATEEAVGHIPFQFKQHADPAVRMLRGAKMGTGGQAFDEMAAALQFPWYFGENWNAVIDCLRDLAWMPAAGYLFVVTSAEQLFARDRPQLESLVSAVEHAGRHWDEPIARGEWWDRPARPFHVLFQADAAAVDEVAGTLRRCASSGADAV